MTRCDGVMEIGRWWVGGEEVGAEGLREVEVDGEDGGVRAGGWRDGGNGGSLRVREVEGESRKGLVRREDTSFHGNLESR